MPNKTLPLTLLILALALAYSTGELRGQPVSQTPDCVVPISLTGAASAPGGNGFDNRTVACTTWTLAYQSSGFSGLTLTFQSSLGSVTPTSYGNYTGTVITGAIASTSTTGAQSTFSNGVVVTPWVRVTLSGLTGSGTVNGVLYGWRAGDSSGSTGGTSGCPGTAGTPCVVDGVTASGSPPTTAPVLVAGVDGTNIQTLKTDVNGRLLHGAYNTTAALTVTASGLTKVITHAAGTTTINHISLAFASAVDFQLEYGTGSNCGTGTTALSGLYKSILAVALDVPFIVPAGQDVCINLGSAVTGGGLAIYATP